MNPPRLQIVRRFRVGPARVYAACSDPALLSRWYGPKDWTVTAFEADVVVGGTFRFTMVGPPGQMSAEGSYEIVEPPHRLVHTWRWSEGPPEYPPEDRISRVTYLIEAEGDGTRLTFTHEGLEDQESADSHEEGWSEALDKLERLLTDEETQS